MPEVPQRSLPSVTIYTDGGADPNPGPGGWGAVLVHPASGRTEELRGGEPRATNNRMELTAAIRALEGLRQRCRVELYTDSQYLRRGVTEWLPGWIARGWRRKTGELQNEDLWRRLAAVATQHEVHWKWVKGHAGHQQNERADQLATASIREQRATAGAGATSRDLAAGRAEPAEYEVFLRVSRSGQGAGWAALVRRQSPESLAEQGVVAGEQLLSGGLPAGTAASANAVDLVAAAKVLEALPEGVAVAVHTVSDYLRHGASRWLPSWRERGWKTKQGGPVLNRELWQRLAAAMATRRMRWPEVKDRDIEELDRLATLAKAAAQRPAGK